RRSTSPGRGPKPRRFRTWTIVLSSGAAGTPVSSARPRPLAVTMATAMAAMTTAADVRCREPRWCMFDLIRWFTLGAARVRWSEALDRSSGGELKGSSAARQPVALPGSDLMTSGLHLDAVPRTVSPVLRGRVRNQVLMPQVLDD